MLFDFPKLKQEIKEEILLTRFEAARNSDPLLSQIKYFIQHEGSDSTYQTVDGDTVVQDYQTLEVTQQITPDDVINLPFEEVVKKFEILGENATSTMAKYSFRKIDETIDKTGNSIKANGPITPELFLEMIRKIDIDFDEETGQAKLPSFYIHPSQAESVKKMIKEAEADPQHKVKFNRTEKEGLE